jgi:hypothetical protein
MTTLYKEVHKKEVLKSKKRVLKKAPREAASQDFYEWLLKEKLRVTQEQTGHVAGWP